MKDRKSINVYFNETVIRKSTCNQKLIVMNQIFLKRKIIFILILCVFETGIQQSFAQQTNIDSFISVLKITKADTNKVNTFYKLSDVYYDAEEPVKAIEYANQGLNLSNKIVYKKGESICLNALGLAYYQMGNFDTALINFEKRYKIVTEINDSMGIASTYDNMGIIQIHFGNNKKALELRTKANTIYRALQKTGYLATGYLWIGNIYKEQGEYVIALENYLKALKIYEVENDEQNVAYSFVNISSIYRYQKQYDLTKKYVTDAKEIFEKFGNKYGIGVSLYRLAIIYTEESDYDNSIKYLSEAKPIFEESQNAYFLTLVNQSLGNCYRYKRNNDLALKYFNSALETSQGIGDLALILAVNQNIGTVYFDKGDYIKALEYMKKSEKVLIEINDKNSLMELSQNFIEIYSHLNKPDSVSKYFQRYQELSDSLFSDQNSQKIAEMQTKYETEKKERELEFSSIKIQKQKNELILLTLLLIALLASSIVIYFLQRKKHQKNLFLAKSILEKRKLQEEEIKNRIRNTISDEATKEILDKLTFEIETRKCYLEPELNIKTLAKRNGTNREYLSQIIHKTFEKNFNEFVNYYRVQESIEILKKIVTGENTNWTMDTLAEKSGFNSSSTFYTAFKLETNMSPGAFKKALKEI